MTRIRFRSPPTVAAQICGGALLLALVGGCRRADDGEITEVRQLREPRGTVGRRVTDVERFTDPAAPSAANRPGSGLAWDLPPGWFEKEPTDVRIANFGITQRPDLECYLSMLPGDAGSARANIDRWRKQMGREPIADAEFSSLTQLPLMSRPALFVDIPGKYTPMGAADAVEGYRMLGLIAEFPMMSLFFKMVGPQADVAAELEAFKHIAESVRFGEAAPTTPQVTMHEDDELHWSVPAGWRDAGPRPNRVVTLELPAVPAAECYVAVLGGTGGGVIENLNRWNNQMGRPPLSGAEVAQLAKVEICGISCPLLEAAGRFVAMDGTATEDALLLGAVCLLRDRAVFVKMTGPREAIAAERDAFIEFCRSIRE